MDMATEEISERNLGQKIWAWADSTDLLYVMLGGATGGFLMPLVKRFLNSKSPFTNGIKFPEVWDAWFFAAVLGAICAGVVVYTLSYSENNNRRQIFFISLLAGLTFPSFLTTTLDIQKTVEDQTAEIHNAEDAAETVADESATEEQKIAAVKDSTDSLKDALTEVKADTLDEEDKLKIEGNAEDVVGTLLDGAEQASAEQEAEVTIKIADRVEGVLATAKKQGYTVIDQNDEAKQTRLLNLRQRAEVLRRQRSR